MLIIWKEINRTAWSLACDILQTEKYHLHCKIASRLICELSGSRTYQAKWQVFHWRCSMSTGCYWNSVEGTSLQSTSSWLSLVQAAGQVVIFPLFMKTDSNPWADHHGSLTVRKVKQRKVLTALSEGNTGKWWQQQEKINPTPFLIVVLLPVVFMW